MRYSHTADELAADCCMIPQLINAFEWVKLVQL